MARERIEFTGQDESPSSATAREDVSARAIRDPTARGSGARWEPAIDLENDIEEEAQFLRTQKRVAVRRGPLAKQTASRIRTGSKFAAAIVLAAVVSLAAHSYGVSAARFRINSSDDIEINGVHNTSRAQVMDIAGADIGRNIFFVDLDERQKKLEQLPWVESATVMRVLPNRIAVDITERTPVAFVQMGAKIYLIDAGGVVLGPPANRQARFSFPVIHGIAETEPLSSRAAVMQIYNRMMRELESGGYTQQVSEVDLSDPEDVRATINDAGGTVVLHLGASDFLERYKLYAAHISEWRQQVPKLQSVDLRYEGQIVVNPDTEHARPSLAPPATKPAVKPVAKAPAQKTQTPKPQTPKPQTKKWKRGKKTG